MPAPPRRDPGESTGPQVQIEDNLPSAEREDRTDFDTQVEGSEQEEERSRRESSDEGSRPAPRTRRGEPREDSGRSRDGEGVPPAGGRRRRPGSEESREEASEDERVERLRQRALATEQWARRLQDAQRTGHELTRGRRPAETPADRETSTPTRRQAQNEEDDPILQYIYEPLRREDDKTFIRRLAEVVSRQVSGTITSQQRDVALARSVTQLVKEEAPDVPMKMFWACLDEAVATHPNDMAKQIEEAINISRRELSAAAEVQGTRRTRNDENREEAEGSIGRGGRGPRAGREAPSSDEEGMVSELRQYQRSKR